MKQLLHLKTMLVTLLTMLVCTGVFAEDKTSTLKFTKACGGTGTADDGVTWTITSDGTESSFDSSKGIHYGTGSSQVSYIKLSTSGIPSTINKIIVNASTASGVSATVNVTVGGSDFGTQGQVLTSSAADYTFTGSASGEIIVKVQKPQKATKALYVKSIAVTYSVEGTTPPENSFAKEEDEATIGESYIMPQFSTKSDGAISYGSSNTDVATINNNGEITLIKGGSTTITAKTAQTAKYAAGEASYVLTVKRGKPTLSFSVEEFELEKGSEKAGPTLTKIGGGDVTYSVNSEIATIIKKTGYIKALEVGEAIVTAESEETEAYESATATYKLIVTPVFEVNAAGTYELVTSIDDLEKGTQVIIANIANTCVMGAKQDNNFAVESNKILFNENNTVIEVEAESTTTAAILEGNDADGWYFHVNGGYLYAGSSDKNLLKVRKGKDDTNAKAKISFNENDAIVKFQGSNERNIIRYNSGNSIFSCYSTGQSPIQIYRKKDSQTLPKVPISFAESIVEITYGDNYDKQKATAEGFSGNLVYTSSDENVVKFHGNGVIDVLGPGTVTITATAPATETTSESSATYTLKIYEPADKVEGAALSLDEHFNDCDGSRPTDNPGDKEWNGTNDFKSLPETCNWTVDGTASPAGNGCLKLGTGTAAGDATSPSFTLNGMAPLSFDIAPWTSTSDGIITGSESVTVTLTNATFEDGSTTKTVGDPFTIGWNHFEYDVTGSGDVTINFHGSSQFFLDNVVVGGGAQPAHEINLTFSSAGYLTWVATADIDFAHTAGVTAYKITEATPKKITMVEVDKVKAGEAVMLKGSGTVQLTRTTGVEAFTDNKMLPCTDGKVTGNGVNGETQTDVYVLGNGKNGLGFYMLKGTLQAGKGYLQVSESEGHAKQSFIAFDITTGVKSVEAYGNGDDAVYNLQGIRVANPQKGIYVKNGKKFIIK
jgi:hypothetical protein